MSNQRNQSHVLLEVLDLAWIPPRAETPLWREVSFQLKSGELVVLTGESGSGKSTLLRCIVGLEKRAAGSVLWRGQPIDEHNIRAFRNRVLYVHQTPVAIAPTVAENLSFPRNIHRQFAENKDIADAMNEEEQRDLLDHFGLAKIELSRRFDELSVGEQQRLALVRCLSLRPDVLLLDEPTASLDEANARRVEGYIASYLKESNRRAVIWIGHDREQRERLDGRRLDLGKWVSS